MAAERVTTKQMRAATEAVAAEFTAVATTMRPEGELTVTAAALFRLGQRLQEFGELYGRYFLQDQSGHPER